MGETVGQVVSLSNEGALLRRLGRWRESDARFVEASALAQRADRDGRVPAYVLANHARLLVSLARDDEALALLARARAQGDLTPNFAAVGRLAEGLVRAGRGEVEAARPLHASLVPTDRSPLPAMHRPVVTLLEAMIARAAGTCRTRGTR